MIRYLKLSEFPDKHGADGFYVFRLNVSFFQPRGKIVPYKADQPAVIPPGSNIRRHRFHSAQTVTGRASGLSVGIMLRNKPCIVPEFKVKAKFRLAGMARRNKRNYDKA